MLQAKTCKVHLKETAKILPARKFILQTIHQIIHRTSAELCPLSDILLLEAGRPGPSNQSGQSPPTAVADLSGPLQCY
jgi:hypothetical protein